MFRAGGSGHLSESAQRCNPPDCVSNKILAQAGNVQEATKTLALLCALVGERGLLHAQQ
jgi:hypothetical protein